MSVNWYPSHVGWVPCGLLHVAERVREFSAVRFQEHAAETMYFFVRNLDIWLHYRGGTWIPQLAGASFPVLDQMTPPGNVMAALNSSGNLAAEANHLPVSVSATSTILPDNVMFGTLTSDPQAWARARGYAT